MTDIMQGTFSGVCVCVCVCVRVCHTLCLFNNTDSQPGPSGLQEPEYLDQDMPNESAPQREREEVQAGRFFMQL